MTRRARESCARRPAQVLRPARERPRGDERPADATKVSAALEPPQAARAIRPRSRRVCDARCTPIPRPTPQLTGGLVRPRRRTILPERRRKASHDASERSELLYHRPQVGADSSAPSWRRWGGCARSSRAWCPWRARGGRRRPRARRCGSGGGARVGARRCGAGRRVEAEAWGRAGRSARRCGAATGLVAARVNECAV